jgi:sugar fermentation stimulation protein A
LDFNLHMATLIRRYKRFLADVEMPDGSTRTVHCPNTGSMRTCGQAGDTIYLSHHPGKGRKYEYCWELTQTPQGFVGINTHLPNKLVEEALEGRKIPEFHAYPTWKREVTAGESRLDFRLEGPTGICWVEVKNVTLLEGDTLYFPDAVSARGTKHLETLQRLKQNGDRAVLFFVVNRTDGQRVAPAAHIDPTAFAEARRQGVECLAYRSCLSPGSIFLGNKVEVSGF